MAKRDSLPCRATHTWNPSSTWCYWLALEEDPMTRKGLENRGVTSSTTMSGATIAISRNEIYDSTSVYRCLLSLFLLLRLPRIATQGCPTMFVQYSTTTKCVNSSIWSRDCTPRLFFPEMVLWCGMLLPEFEFFAVQKAFPSWRKCIYNGRLSLPNNSVGEFYHDWPAQVWRAALMVAKCPLFHPQLFSAEIYPCSWCIKQERGPRNFFQYKTCLQWDQFFS